MKSSTAVSRPSEVLARVGSATVMAAVAIAATLAGVWPFAALIGLGAVVVAWEWGRLVRHEQGATMTLAVHAATLAAAAGLGALGKGAAALAALIAGALIIAALRRGDGWSIAGVFYLGLPVVSLVAIRADPDFGVAAIFYLFAIVWCADTAAFGFGRLIGGPRLAPRISPNKTWSGFAGAVLLPTAVGYLAAPWFGSNSPLMMAVLSFALAVASQIGDLAESAAKRAFGRKDASRLIPGHGGLLDRVDGLIFASCAAAAVALMRDGAHPGQALLLWP